ncbi:hypothetical protein N657DRAFT_359339 [Parathielavia appendiculata]|uniref:Uncharacterized protein n=1 Tax=Parathielavia appendiculata TaxID=2587402 RepID=A0AAN6U502_9PEZI|nr:hypothetical protein N657DRAFT_359339 [Parathielavia appendiculata]
MHFGDRWCGTKPSLQPPAAAKRDCSHARSQSRLFIIVLLAAHMPCTTPLLDYWTVGGRVVHRLSLFWITTHFQEILDQRSIPSDVSDIFSSVRHSVLSALGSPTAGANRHEIILPAYAESENDCPSILVLPPSS